MIAFRYCDRCGEVFNPMGKYCRLCEACKEESTQKRKLSGYRNRRDKYHCPYCSFKSRLKVTMNEHVKTCQLWNFNKTVTPKKGK